MASILQGYQFFTNNIAGKLQVAKQNADRVGGPHAVQEHTSPWGWFLVELGSGLRLDEAKQLTAALHAGMVSAQMAVVGERCERVVCGVPLASRDHHIATPCSLFGDVPVRVRRLLTCLCQDAAEPKSFAALDLGGADWKGSGP